MNKLLQFFAFAAVILCGNNTLLAQPNSTVEVEKTGKYENRRLKSEKTGEKKFGIVKRINQNAKTRFNFFFNANNKLNDVVDAAKLQHKEDYTKLLPFYSYSLDATAQQKQELDSVIYKATAGILLHDLRSDWVDDMYMLIGKAYMYRKDFDSARLTYQYINYAFAPKDDGYDIPIGSNLSNETNVFTISTKESKNIFKKIISKSPKRNESFLWQARNFIEDGDPNEAMGLLQILRSDPYFPKRLSTELHEVTAYAFYKMNAYDSAAYHLRKALDEAEGRQEKARWEYLIAQLYTRSGNTTDALKYYEKSISHTTNPVMEVYARLAAITLNNSGKKEEYQKKNLDELLKMAKKDRYDLYRDIIYYAAAQIALDLKDYKGAQKWLQKSIDNSTANPSQRSEAFLLMADINYDQKSYSPSYNYYDSTDTRSLEVDAQGRVTLRKPPLKVISQNQTTISLQDSLLRLASLPEAERNAQIKKIVRQLRKAKGLKDESTGGNNNAGNFNSLNNAVTAPVFTSNTSGDWYFANASLKAQGFSEFRSKYGNRPNADNWRRQAAVALAGGTISNTKIIDTAAAAFTNNPFTDDGDITFESVNNTLPLVPEKVVTANRLIVDALYNNAQQFQNQLEDYPSAIEAYEEILKRDANTKYKEELLFNLAYLYAKINNAAKADSAKQSLQSQFASGKFAQRLNPAKANEGDKAVTKKYEGIYNKFLEGNFAEALNEKKAADSLYGSSYWTPQLSFIESIYYVKQKQDSLAIVQLNNVVATSANNDFKEKAKTMIDVLKRRKEIESYLTNLQIERQEDDASGIIDLTEKQQPQTKPVTISQPVTQKAPTVVVNKDSIITKPVIAAVKGFSFNATEPQYVMMVFNKVEATFVNEAKNAFARYNKESFATSRLQGKTDNISEGNNVLLLGIFANASDAIAYMNKIKPQAKDRILPWLTPDKYSFLIISESNLEALKENKDFDTYRKVLAQSLPGIF